ncbi:hypothetical protein Y032_0427g1268 [Ancylostoma ceylanicum]|uniref:Uncharacterized protein n=1 Tax=Ancylostoma ceylanicum TaxID=53326 RepID=A0A016X0K1_9BILA|nr:hypothetical protein Y032_0427g1268 [Ancylostoma ceylanicum]
MDGRYHECRSHPQREDPGAVRHRPEDTSVSEDTICKVDLGLEVTVKRPEEWPKKWWLDTLHADLKHVGVHPDQAHDRVKWHQENNIAYPAIKREKC